MLGGVEIPFPKGLEGHSDADVLAHAICDALLGAAALGDIGEHFPDTDEKWRGASGTELLVEVAKMLASKGWRIGNVDATVIAQEPQISPFKLQMREKIAGTLDLDLDDVSIKATTTEGLDACGRGEGIAAAAVTSIF